MTTASPSEQAVLLDLAEIDTHARQLAHKRRTLPELAELSELSAASSTVAAQRVQAATTVSDLQRAVRKAEADVEQVRTRAARDTERLNAGTGSAKDLTGLQHELESLGRRQAELEDVELEAMEQLESAEGILSGLDADGARLTEQIDLVTARRDAAFAGIDSESAQLDTRRAEVVGAVAAELLALYERVRENSGVAAAKLVGTRCGGCRVEFPAMDLSEIRSAAPDMVVQCEECRCILIREQ